MAERPGGEGDVGPMPSPRTVLATAGHYKPLMEHHFVKVTYFEVLVSCMDGWLQWRLSNGLVGQSRRYSSLWVDHRVSREAITKEPQQPPELVSKLDGGRVRQLGVYSTWPADSSRTFQVRVLARGSLLTDIWPQDSVNRQIDFHLEAEHGDPMQYSIGFPA